MQRVVGLDLSLTCTGIAVITRRVDGSTIANATSITSRGKRDDGLIERAARIADLASAIDRSTSVAVLAVIEAPVYNAKGGSPLDRSFLWWSVVSELIHRGIPVAPVAPTKLKKAVTGSGAADKAAVAAAVTRLWPDVELGNSDQGDALALAHLGAVHLGWSVETLQRHRDAVGGIAFPPAQPTGIPA